MNVLVTGCAGFIGSTLTELLLSKGHFVVGVDNFNDFYDPEIKRTNIKNSVSNSNFVLEQRDLALLTSGLFGRYGINCVVHLAAYPGVRPSFNDPALYTQVNIGGTLRLLELMRELSISNGVFASSSSVYGNNPDVPFAESARVAPISIYGATKLALESYCRTYAKAYGMDLTCLRFFTCYGPRQRPDLAIHKFARLLKKGSPIPMFGDGSTSRDYTYIEDIVRGVYRAMERPHGFDIINLGNSYPVSLYDMISTIATQLGVKPDIKQQAIPAGDVLHTWASTEKAERVLGWHPTTTFTDGIAKFLEWLPE